MAFLFVALGGAIGAMARYAISLIPVKTGFPVLTLITNILGAILIGFIVGIASSHENIPENAILFLKTGVCGGFTTLEGVDYFVLASDTKNFDPSECKKLFGEISLITEWGCSK